MNLCHGEFMHRKRHTTPEMMHNAGAVLSVVPVIVYSVCVVMYFYSGQIKKKSVTSGNLL